MLEECNNIVKSCALQSFDKLQHKPLQPWISQKTWGVLQFAAPLRRQQHKAIMVLKKQVITFWFLAWASTKHADFVPQSITDGEAHGARIPVHGWAAVGRMQSVVDTLQALDLLVALFHALLANLHHVIKIFVAAYRVEYLWTMAWRAANAMNKQQSAEAFKIVRLLGGYSPKTLKAVKHADGFLTQSNNEYIARWQEHFALFFRGKVMDSLSCAHSAPSHPVPIKDSNPTVDHVHVQIMKLGSGKAAGPDGICAELLKAGGHVMACLFHPVVSRLVCSQVGPTL